MKHLSAWVVLVLQTAIAWGQGLEYPVDVAIDDKVSSKAKCRSWPADAQDIRRKTRRCLSHQTSADGNGALTAGSA